MSSLSWDFPSPPTNPTADDDDTVEIDRLGRPEGASNGHDETSPADLLDREPSEREQIEALEREQLEALERERLAQLAREPSEGDQIEALEQLEREQIEALEREQLEALEQEQIGTLERERERMEQLAELERAELASEQSEREQLEQLEREGLRQLEELGRQQNAQVAPAPRRPEPAPVERPRPEVQARETPSPAAAAETRPGVDAQARAAAFLAAAQERQALEEAARGGQGSAPATELRELSEPARAARAIVEQRHRSLVEANALLTEARRVLAPIAYRGISDRIYRRRKVILAIGEAVSLGVAFSAAFDVAPLEALLLSGAIALAFVIAGDLGGVLRLTAERSRLSAAVEDGVMQLDPRYLHILYYDRQPWLSIIGGVTAGIFALAAVSVGVLRAANQGSLGLAAGLALLTVSLAIAAGLSSWQHASIGSEIIEHLQREEEAAADRLKRAAAARVLRNPPILTSVRTDELGMPSQAPDLDWPAAPNMDWQTPDVGSQVPRGEKRAKRPARAGRAKREKPDRREKSSGGLVGAAAAKGALALASLPGKFRRSEKKAAKVASDSDYDSAAGGGWGERRPDLGRHLHATREDPTKVPVTRPRLVLVALALLALGSACGGSSEEPSASPTTVASTSPPTTASGAARPGMPTVPTADERSVPRAAVIDGRPVFIVTLPETVLFDVGQAVLRAQAEPSLQAVVELVGDHPGASTEVQGHTDSVGSADFNQSLSERRAAAVSDWLAGHGVAPGTLTKAGYGATRPVADNATPEGRQANRRVEIIVHLA